MSSNNYIKIKRINNHYSIKELDAETGAVIHEIDSKAPTLEIAINRANHFMSKNDIEYGLEIKL